MTTHTLPFFIHISNTMSREQYQVPTGSGGSGGYGGGGQAGGVVSSRTGMDDLVGPEMYYICGDCGVKLALRKSEPIRCQECGCRVLYKQRTKR